MKKILFFLLAVSFLSFGCKNGDDADDRTLSYDGDNNISPFLVADVYQTAARFPSSVTTPFQGRMLEEVEFYLLDVPSTCAVLIYGEGTADEPGNLLYSRDVTSSVNVSSWNSHTLNTPVEITGEDLWICLEVTHPQEIRSVGCDFGPAVSNGDWIFSGANGQWETLRDFTDGEVDINWNIRGIVSKE